MRVQKIRDQTHAIDYTRAERIPLEQPPRVFGVAIEQTDVQPGSEAAREVELGAMEEVLRELGRIVSGRIGMKINLRLAGKTTQNTEIQGVLSAGLRMAVPLRISFVPVGAGPMSGRSQGAAQSRIC